MLASPAGVALPGAERRRILRPAQLLLRAARHALVRVPALSQEIHFPPVAAAQPLSSNPPPPRRLRRRPRPRGQESLARTRTGHPHPRRALHEHVKEIGVSRRPREDSPANPAA